MSHTHRGSRCTMPVLTGRFMSSATPFERPNAPESWWAEPGLTRAAFDVRVAGETRRMACSWFGQRLEPCVLEQPQPRKVAIQA